VRITKKPERTRLETITTLLQAMSAILVPIVVAVAGLIIQQSIAKQTTAKDYVSLAIDILKVDPKTQDLFKGNPLRDWAADVLVLDSPVPISKEAQRQLRTTQVLAYEPTLPQGFVSKALEKAMVIDPKALEKVLELWEKSSATPTPKPSETP
jgi:hypothetical protein